MKIEAQGYEVIFNELAYESIAQLLVNKEYSKLVILTDNIVNEAVLPKFLQRLQTTIDFEIIEIESGEESKSIDTCIELWNILSDFEIDRNALLINVGGGMVTDLGGFVASTYKRGIDFVNVPTSLLAMVDASVGGKTGINLNFLKNMVGTFTQPQMVIIDASFLETLPGEHLRSGLAEMYKHGLIADKSYWNQLKHLDQLGIEDLEMLIYHSIAIKNAFVTEDPFEKNIRKALNFGHTLGHAIETWSHQSQDVRALLHGEAIAIGTILEAYLSYKKNYLKRVEFEEIQNTLNLMFEGIVFSKNDIEICINFLKHDKKNQQSEIQFVLLKEIGQFVINQTVPLDWIYEAFDVYNKN